MGKKLGWVILTLAILGFSTVKLGMAENNASVQVTRHVARLSLENNYRNVKLSISVKGVAPNGLIIKEYIPSNSTLIDADPLYSSYDSNTREIKWIFIGADVREREIYYKVQTRGSEEKKIYGWVLYKDSSGQHVVRKISDST